MARQKIQLHDQADVFEKKKKDDLITVFFFSQMLVIPMSHLLSCRESPYFCALCNIKMDICGFEL